MKARAMVRRIVRLACGAGLILMTAFWTVVLGRLIVGFAAGGADGARGELHGTLLGGRLWDQIEHDPIMATSRGYEGLLLLLLVTWGLREVYARLGKRG